MPELKESVVETVHVVNERLLERLRELATEKTVKVGVINKLAEKQEGGRISMANLMQVHEFGTDRAGKNHNVVIPERSVIRATARLQRLAIRQKQGALLSSYLKDKITIDQALNALGLFIVDKMRAYMMEGIAPPWADSTLKARLARKNAKPIIAVRPLVDTGALYRSIKHEIEGGK